jgi:hypothetical protein
MKNMILMSVVFLIMCLNVWAEVEFTSEPYVFSVDTRGEPIFVDSLSDDILLWCQAGGTVTAKEMFSNDNEVPILNAVSTDYHNWKPKSGGVWLLENAKEGTATVKVRYSLFAEQTGTIESPAKFVDAEEFKERIEGLAAHETLAGYVFFVTEPSLLDCLPLYPGMKIENIDGFTFTYKFTVALDDVIYQSGGMSFVVDSKRDGPNRRLRKGQTMPIAYSGDNWLFKGNSISRMIVTDPSGTDTEYDGIGTDVRSIVFDEVGVWKIGLESVCGSIEAKIDVLHPYFAVTFR